MWTKTPSVAEQDVPSDGQMVVNGRLGLRGIAGHQGIEDYLDTKYVCLGGLGL